MKEFNIILRSMQDVQDFVALSTAQPFEVQVGSNGQYIDGKDFMGMFTLDYRYPLRVCISCSDDEYSNFRQAAAAYAV